MILRAEAERLQKLEQPKFNYRKNDWSYSKIPLNRIEIRFGGED